VLPVTASEHSDVVGASGTADSVKRDRPDSTSADVQLSESHFVGEATADPALRLRR